MFHNAKQKKLIITITNNNNNNGNNVINNPFELGAQIFSYDDKFSLS